MREKSLFVLALLGIVLLSACSSQEKNIEKAKLGMTGIRIALSGYAQYDGTYPTTEQGLQALVAKPTLPPEPAGWKGPYLEADALLDSWGNQYRYRSPSADDPERYKYDLYSYGPDGEEGSDDIVGRAKPKQKSEESK